MNKRNVKIGMTILIVIILGYILYTSISNSNYEKNLTEYPSDNQILNDIKETMDDDLGYYILNDKKLNESFDSKYVSLKNLKQSKETEKKLTITGDFNYETDIFTFKDKIKIYYTFDGKKYKYDYAILEDQDYVEIYLTECKEEYQEQIKEALLKQYPSFNEATFKEVRREDHVNDKMACAYNYTGSSNGNNYDLIAYVQMYCDPVKECSYSIYFDRSY